MTPWCYICDRFLARKVFFREGIIEEIKGGGSLRVVGGGRKKEWLWYDESYGFLGPETLCVSWETVKSEKKRVRTFFSEKGNWGFFFLWVSFFDIFERTLLYCPLRINKCVGKIILSEFCGWKIRNAVETKKRGFFSKTKNWYSRIKFFFFRRRIYNENFGYGFKVFWRL